MKCLFSCANQYVKESDWKDFALVKLCLCAIGVMIGLAIPKKKKKMPLLIACHCIYCHLYSSYDKVSPDCFPQGWTDAACRK